MANLGLAVFFFLMSAFDLQASSQRPLVHEIYGPELRISWPDGERLHEEVMNLFYAGDYVGAAQKLDQAIAAAEQSSAAKEKDLAILLTTKGQGTALLGDTKEADALLVRARNLGATVLATNHPVLARVLAIRAEVLVLRGNFSEAKTLLQEAMAALLGDHKTNDLAYAMSLRLNAIVDLAEGRAFEARDALRESSGIIERISGRESALYGANQWVESMVAANMGNYMEAIRLCQSSLANATNCYGPDHLALTSIRTTLADIYQQTGFYERALPLLQDNLRAQEMNIGSDSVVVSTTLNSLGALHYRMGNYADAERVLRRCLTIREKNLGVDSPGYAAAVNNLALVLIALGRDADVSKLFKDAATTLDKSLGKDSTELATVLLNWGMFSHRLGQTNIAKSLFEEAIAIRDRAYGKNHLAIAEAAEAYARLQLDFGDVEYAHRLAQLALSIKRTFYGSEHPAIAESLDLLARIHVAEKNYDEALGLLAESAAIKLRSLGAFHPSLGDTLESTAFVCQAIGEYPTAIVALNKTFPMRHFLLTTQVGKTAATEVQGIAQSSYYRTELFHSLLFAAPSDFGSLLAGCGAEQLALNKAFLEELEVIQAALEVDPSTTTKELHEAYRSVQARLTTIAANGLEARQKDDTRRALQAELADIEMKLAKRVALLGDRSRESQRSNFDLAAALPQESCLVDFIQYRHYDFAAKTNRWKEQHYAAYLTFPLAGDSTNVIVERVDLGEAAPINEAVELVCKRMSAGQLAAKDLAAALQRLSLLVYTPLAPHLTNVAHLVVCPDGQLSRLPFEMLPVGNKFLVEEKAISYVTSGREVVRVASAKSEVRSPKSSGMASKSLVMGDPDFDLDLRSSRREEALTKTSQPSTLNSQPKDQSLLTSAATKALSRSYTGIKFLPLPGSGVEATNVARLLGQEAVLRLGSAAREAELKAVVSPRVLHLATHGFFLSDQEFKQTNLLRDSWSANMGTRWNASLPKEDWENPLVRCGIALAGANYATNLMSRSSRREEALKSSPQPSTISPQPGSQSLLTSAATGFEEEDGLLTGLEAALLNLQGTELVILSACDSGTGEVKIGEGVMSLRRAFRIAGAETVLASHWKVSDKATSRLMTEFMRRWRAGEPRAKAWREAQLSLLHSKDFSNSYFWAAFTLTGQWR